MGNGDLVFMKWIWPWEIGIWTNKNGVDRGKWWISQPTMKIWPMEMVHDILQPPQKTGDMQCAY
jgi:hypothetical protein